MKTNNRKKLFITLGVIVSVFVTAAAFTINSTSFNKNTSGTRVNFSEVKLNEDSLLKGADAVVIGKISEKTKEKTEVINSNDNKSASVNWNYSVYRLDVKEALESEIKNKVDIVFAGSTLPNDLELNKEYVFFLEKDMLGGDAYHLLSYSQGAFEIKEDKFENKNSQIAFKKTDLIEKIKKAKKK